MLKFPPKFEAQLPDLQQKIVLLKTSKRWAPTSYK